jgi:hypothetical protein
MQYIALILVAFLVYVSTDAIVSNDPHVTINDTEVTRAVAEFLNRETSGD